MGKRAAVPTPFDRFKDLAGKLAAVPKRELDEQRAKKDKPQSVKASKRQNVKVSKRQSVKVTKRQSNKASKHQNVYDY